MQASGIAHTASQATAASTSQGRTAAASNPSRTPVVTSTDHGVGPSLVRQPPHRPVTSASTVTSGVGRGVAGLEVAGLEVAGLEVTGLEVASLGGSQVKTAPQAGQARRQGSPDGTDSLT